MKQFVYCITKVGLTLALRRDISTDAGSYNKGALTDLLFLAGWGGLRAPASQFQPERLECFEGLLKLIANYGHYDVEPTLPQPTLHCCQKSLNICRYWPRWWPDRMEYPVLVQVRDNHLYVRYPRGNPSCTLPVISVKNFEKILAGPRYKLFFSLYGHFKCLQVLSSK